MHTVAAMHREAHTTQQNKALQPMCCCGSPHLLLLDRNLRQVYSHVTPERIRELKAGAAVLPLSERFVLPAPVSLVQVPFGAD